MSETCDMACTILHLTDDGNELEPHLLALVENAVNGNLSPEGRHLFLILHDTVKNGHYIRPWFHNIEHLVRDHEGYVYWKGQRIEHYSFRNYRRERDAAIELAKKCRLMEQRGLQVNLMNLMAFVEYEYGSQTPGRFLD